MPGRLSLSATKAVLFDIDGTLVDSLAMLVRGLGDTYELYAGTRPPEEEIRKLIGLPLKVQLHQFRTEPMTEVLLDEMTRFTLDRFKHYRYLEQEFGPSVEALALCRHSGIRTALVTSKSRPELDALLTRFSGADHADVLVCASDVQHPKPHPESALLACHRLATDPQEALFIGDSVFDLQCGRSAGTATAAVLYGSGSEDALLAERPDLVFRTPEDLLGWARGSLLTPCQERK